MQTKIQIKVSFLQNRVITKPQSKVFPVKHTVAICLGFLLLCLHLPASAKDQVGVGNINNVNFGTWSNSGNLSITVDHCVLSANTKEKKPKPSDSTVPYNAKIRNRQQNDGFYLYLDGQKNAIGNERILISFSHRDLLAPSIGETLTNDQYDFENHNGQFRDCPLGNNSEISIDISGGELSSKVNGVYEGRFEFRARNNDDEDRANFDVEITVQRGPEVRISNLDTVNFGQHSGLGNLQFDERLCVYSNSASGSYRLSVGAPNQDAGGNFYLADSLSGGLIPLTVLFGDTGTGSGTLSMTNNYFSGIGDSGTEDCGGSDNATLSLSMTEADLQAAKTGNYSETLIILVEPE